MLDTEKYGGMLMNTWFDRPLSVAGRIIVERDGKLEARLVDVDRDLMIIPSVAIHMNRAANDGVKLLANVDTFPLLGCGAQDLRAIVAEAAGVAPEQILGHDLFLYLRGRGSVLGAEGELIGSPKLDDLACAFALTEGFLQSSPSGAIPVLAVFDNEEVGSETKQGAASNFLRDTLRRLTLALGKTEEDYLRWCAGSFLVSADNAHAQHPNHPEFADAQNTPYLNGGVVVKFNANQRLRDRRGLRGGVPPALPRDGRADTDLREPVRPAGRLDARVDLRHARRRADGGYRAGTAGDALGL